MRNTFLLFAAIALTVLCWGLYGSVLKQGQVRMAADAAASAAATAAPGTAPSAVHPASLRPFVCVGLAYFLIGVLVPAVWLHYYGEKGNWTVSGLVWSLAGGAMGALGALGIILAFKFGGQPIYVMPLVFGGAPVVNAFLTIYLAGRMKEIGPLFLAGLVIVILGAVDVMLSAPGPPRPAPVATADVAAAAPAAKPAAAAQESTITGWFLRVLAIVLAIGSWGAYGPVLHKGQAAMHHSRLRPLLCVGLAYFAIAVVIPDMILADFPETSTYQSWGTIWSLLGGTFGALGALGIILAFNSGGRPVFVMPLVFGGAPVINTLVAIASNKAWGSVSPFFWAGLILVVAGAAMVLVLAPRGDGPAPAMAKA